MINFDKMSQRHVDIDVQSKTIVLEAFEFLTIRDSVRIINFRSHDKTAQ